VLYPFRTTVNPIGQTASEDWKKSPLGATIPVVSQRSDNALSIKVEGRDDQWTFTTNVDGRSRISLQRGGKEWEIR